MISQIQINLTKLWAFTKAHPELIKEVNFKNDGKCKLLDANIHASKNPTEYSTHFISARYGKDAKPQTAEEWNTYNIGTALDKDDDNNNTATASTHSASPTPQSVQKEDDEEALPF